MAGDGSIRTVFVQAMGPGCGVGRRGTIDATAQARALRASPLASVEWRGSAA
ncbi:MAG: hypothetical protein KDI17_01910 [Halioglobus sp.]|jgi:predicted NBD/HSP70 family sugar kinase|nr:hypothetical protein [Halioglobus sp.]